MTKARLHRPPVLFDETLGRSASFTANRVVPRRVCGKHLVGLHVPVPGAVAEGLGYCHVGVQTDLPLIRAACVILGQAGRSGAGPADRIPGHEYSAHLALDSRV